MKISFIVLLVMFDSTFAAFPELWKREHWNAVNVSSYLIDGYFARESTEGTTFIKDILKVIHALQHPKRSECSSRRLLVLDIATDSLEGFGSILKSVLFNLAVAIHSNRILVWGIGLPYMYGKTQDVWKAKKIQRIKRTEFDCTSADEYNGGPFQCFMQPLSSCKFYKHIAVEDLAEFTRSAYDDDARLMFVENSQTIRKSPSLYHPPMALLHHILDSGSYSDAFKTSIKLKYAHFWTAAVTAYVFRPTRKILDRFENRHVGMISGPVWGLHVRHGDVKALRSMFPFRKVFDFYDYFAAARDHSHVVKNVPRYLHVSSDNPDVASVDYTFDTFQSLPEGDCVEDSEGELDICNRVDEAPVVKGGREKVPTLSHYALQHTTWFDCAADVTDSDNDDGTVTTSCTMPSILKVNNSNRFRTEHGSHVVAAAGACVVTDAKSSTGTCAMPYEEVQRYEAMDSQRDLPPSHRMMVVMMEALEDIFLLSLSDVIIGQVSSHFSTMAVHLMWARTGCRDVTHSWLYLDFDSMVAGTTPCSMIHGTNIQNHTFDAMTSPGALRWQIITNRFISGFPNKPNTVYSANVTLPFNPWSPTHRIAFLNGLPRLPLQTFEREAASWRGVYHPPWPGSCPKGMPKGAPAYEFIAGLVNAGAEHHEEWHHNQATRCWRLALSVLNKVLVTNTMDSDRFAVLLDIVQGNLGFLASRLKEYTIYARKEIEKRDN